MKKLLLLIAILPFLISCNGQESKTTSSIKGNNNDESIILGREVIKDSVFENVIEIKRENVASTEVDYLFNVSIPTTIKTPVLYISAEVPLKLLPAIYPEFPKLTIITPNWELLNDKSFSKEEKRAPSFIIYKFNRTQGNIIKDSVIIYKFPEIKFANKYHLKKNEREFYYADYYGSFCCPKDPQYGNEPTREEFINFFEKENNIKITDVYRESYGKEGEHRFLYPLYGLSNLLKLKFIQDRNFYRIINRHTKDIIKIPTIYTPFILEINDKMQKL